MTGTAFRLGGVFAAALLTSVSLGAVSPAYAEAACKPGGTLRMARDQEPNSIVPWDSTGNGGIFLQIQIYDRLIEQLPGNAEVQPGLAESWEIAPDGLSYTFKIRDAKFSNGDPVTIEDVKFSLDRMIDPAVQVGWNFLMKNVAGFEVVDDKTIRMNMKSVDASILYTLSLPAGGIYSKSALESMGPEKFAETPVGSGPFMVKSWARGEKLELVKNPNYWREGQPHVDAVTFDLVRDANARILKIQSGEADIAQSIPYSQASTLDAVDGINVRVEPYTVMYSVWLNHQIKPFDDKLVRQALNYATPKDVLNEIVLGGLGRIQNHMMSPTRFWDETVPAYPYDIEKAKELISQSSVPEGFTFPLAMSAEDESSLQAAQILQAEWAKIGVTVEITPQDPGSADAGWWDGTAPAFLFPPNAISSDVPDDSEQANIFFDFGEEWKSFGSYYKSDKASELVRAAVATVVPEEREKIYHELQRVVMEDAPQVALLFSPTVTAVGDKVGNFSTLPVGWWRLEQVCFTE